MKKLFIALALTAAGTIGLHAELLTPAQAKARLQASPRAAKTTAVATSSLTRLAMTLTDDATPTVYIFATPQASTAQGFVITSADDRFPALLGYGDTDFDPDNLPDNFRYWLDSYNRQIAWAIANGTADAPAAARGISDFNPDDPDDTLDPITPIVKTTWNQSAPFNNLCPKVGTAKTYTGCVATAMSQVINTHQYPVNGVGTHSYTWSGKTLTFDYEGTTFDWANMRNNYYGSPTVAQQTAVATLMYAAGVSVNMQYGTDASGAMSFAIPSALVDNFGYDKGIRYLMRDYYTQKDWDQIIYDELAAGRAVIYDGVTSNREGHSFVCDGYKDNLYHINWGWGGSSDGYFVLSALDPAQQGIGGAASGAGFNLQQDAVIGIQKPVEGSYAVPTLYADGGVAYTNGSFGFSGGSYNAFYNYSCTPFKGYLGVKLVNQTDKDIVVYAETSSAYSIGGADPNTGSCPGYKSYPVVMPPTLAAGTYRAYPVARFTDSQEWEPIHVMPAYNQYVTVRVGSNGAVTYDGSDPENVTAPAAVTNCTWTNPVQPNTSNFILTTTFSRNNSNAMKVYANFMNKATGKIKSFGYWNITMTQATMTQNLKFNLVLDDGYYSLYFTDQNSGLRISGMYDMTVGNPSGVEAVGEDESQTPAEYYDLQGRRVDNPAPGLYIVRRAGRVTRELIR